MSSLLEVNVTIAGLGLMGGSMAYSLRGAVSKLSACDSDSQTLKFALDEKIVDSATTDLGEALDDTDILILATPVQSISRILRQLPDFAKRHYMVMDLGSTKVEICRSMDVLPETIESIGGHPMCGREQSGLAYASEDLYRNKLFVLSPTATTRRSTLALALEIVEAVGARPVVLAAEVHDQLVAASSHMPYLLSSLLMNCFTDVAAEDDRAWFLTASGFRDMSRLAGSNPIMMHDILTTNRIEIVKQLQSFQQRLEYLISLLSQGDDEELLEMLRSVQIQYQNYQTEKKSVARE